MRLFKAATLSLGTAEAFRWSDSQFEEKFLTLEIIEENFQSGLEKKKNKMNHLKLPLSLHKVDRIRFYSKIQNPVSTAGS